MTMLDRLCRQAEAASVEEKVDLINKYTADVLPVLDALSEDGQSGTEIYTHFILCAVASDGKLAKEEYELIKALFDAAAGKDCSYEEAVAIFGELGLDRPDEYKKVVDLMIDVIGLLSDDVKSEIIAICLLVCAIDGEVSKEEKEWIGQLIDDNFGMSPMDQIDDMLTEVGTFILATEDGDQPRMRVLGFKAYLDGKIYFTVGTFKEVYAQLQKNPKCEILASLGGSFLRWDGNAVFTDDARLMDIADEKMPQVVEAYEKMGFKFAFFTLEGGSAEIVGADMTRKKLF